MIQPQETVVSHLGECQFRSPLTLNTKHGDGIGNFTPEGTRVRYQVELDPTQPVSDATFERAGARELLFFDPRETRAAIVTCGGLCPGLNNVIRSAFYELYHNYRVKEVLGIRYGFQGLTFNTPHQPIQLTSEIVEDIHKEGGTILGSSRGQQNVAEMVDFLVDRKIDLLLCLGGDGTQHGTHEIAQEVLKRGLPIAVVGVPKTIDNDIRFVSQTFGYFTAIEVARVVLDCAHNEAKGAPNGIGLVKLMGRDSGFISVGATLASQEVNFTLIPEVPIKLEGERGFLNILRRRILERHHAVVVVAEGAGQDLMTTEDLGVDASGNKRYQDIGIFLKNEIGCYFREHKIDINLKYIEPSYIIRSVAANSLDAQLCDYFARAAVHAGMAGKTDLLIGFWHGCFIHVPIPLAVAHRRKVDPESELWNSVIATTGQPRVWG